MWPEPKPNQTLARPFFSPRQLVTAADLNAGVDYLVERGRRHNRYLHGCGITCGLTVTMNTDSDLVGHITWLALTISGGAAISPAGDLITVLGQLTLGFQQVRRPNGSISLRALQELLEQSGDTLPLYLVLRHTGALAADAPTWPDDCHRANGGRSPTRLAEGYEFDLTLERPAACETNARRQCAPLLNRRSPLHGAALAALMACPPSADPDGWLVVATVELRRNDLDLFETTAHYRDRTLLPSARALLELLRCFPETPRVDSADAEPIFADSRWYTVRVTGNGFTPFVALEFDDPALSVGQLMQGSDRDFLFLLVVSSEARPGRHNFRIVTGLDVIDSADCGVYLDVQPAAASPYYYHYGRDNPAIGGGLL